VDDSLEHSLGSGPHSAPRAAQVGNYRIERELGRGAQGVVYEVTHAVLNRTFALKLCLEQDEEGRQRFVREARLASQMTSPGLVRVHDYGDLEGRPYYVMELCRGEDLAQSLRRGPLEPKRALRLLADVAGALAEIHSLGIVHRDVKPANLVFQTGSGLQERGPSEDPDLRQPELPEGQERLRLTDFGLARPLGERSLTMSGDLIGSPAYMAPEQAIEAKSVDARADVYSLGAVLYECLTGTPPFLGATFMDTLQQALSVPVRPPSELDPSLAPYDELLLDALAKDPGQRILDMSAFRERLEALLADEAPAKGGPPLALVLGGVALLALVAGAAAAATLGGPSATPSPSPSGNPSGSPSVAATPTPTPVAWTLAETRQRASAAWVASSAPPEVLAALDAALVRAPEHQELRVLRAGLRHLAQQDAGARADLGRLLRANGELRLLEGLVGSTLGTSPWGASLHEQALLGLRASFPRAESVGPRVEAWVAEVAQPARAPLARALTAAACGAPYAELAQDLEAARAAAPDDLALKVWRARILVGRDRYAEAKRAISWIQRERPPTPIRRLATRLEGDLRWRMGDLHDSVPRWEEAATGSSPEAVIARSQAHWLGKPDQNRVESLAMVSDALRQAPDHPRLLSLRCLFLLGSPWEGLRAADTALARGGAVDAQLLGFRAFAYQGVCAEAKLGRLARDEWEGVFRVTEGAYYRIGASGLGMSSEDGRAWIRPYLEASLKLEPERAHVHEYLGALALLDQRPRDEILAFWRKAHELEPRNGLGREWIRPYASRFGEVETRRLLGEIPLRKR
jgi:eukaryotic-like serine/threonine-protein kinase